MPRPPFAMSAGICALLLVSFLPLGALACGVGISTAPDSVGLDLPVVQYDAFLTRRPGTPGERQHRDLEFSWDQLYARDATGLSAATVTALAQLGRAMTDSVSNPYNAPYPDFWLIYGYFRNQGANYNPFNMADITSVRVGLSVLTMNDPDRDRSHVDAYIRKPGNGASAGHYSSIFTTASEDTSSGWTVPRHGNSLDFLGPAEASLNDLSWTAPSSPLVWLFNHEFQHSLPDQEQVGWSTEMFSGAAEVIGGVPSNGAAVAETPYTWSLLGINDAPGNKCTNPSQALGSNYAARRMFASYLAFNFRGSDTTAALPPTLGGTTGFGDDLLYKWAHTGNGSATAGRQFEDLRTLLKTHTSYVAKIDTLGIPFTLLDENDLLQLLHHNFRVANYVNAPQLRDGRYGYPPQFGFAPSNLRAWQSFDGCPNDDVVAIPPKLSLSHHWRDREVTRSGVRLSDGGQYSHPMVLQPYGAEYWITRSVDLKSYNQNLIVSVAAENSDPLGCGGPADPSSRLVASVATFSNQSDSLWRHPEWVQEVLNPHWVDVDSLAGELQFQIGDFGNPFASTPRVAALTTVTLGDGALSTPAGRAGSSLSTPIRYRVSYDLATAPFPQPFKNPLPSKLKLVANVAKSDEFPSWSPSGKDLVYQSSLSGAFSQIYRRYFARDSLNQAQVPLHAASANQYRPDWSPRGDWIVFEQDSAGAGCDLWMKNIVTNELRRLTSSPDFEINAVFQPNGQGLAYVRTQPMAGGGTLRFELRFRDLRSGLDSALVAPGNTATIYSPRWNLDGSRLYFTRNDTLYSVQIPGGIVLAEGVNLGALRGTTLDVPKAAGPFVVEEAGSTSAPSACPEAYRRITVRATRDGGDSRVRYFQTGRHFFNPRISLDGTRVAFASDETVAGDHDISVGILTYDHPPLMSSAVKDAEVIVGHAIYINLAATDPIDDDMVRYTAGYMPPGGSLTGSLFSYGSAQVPGPDSSYYCVFVAYDSAGAQDYRVVRIRVKPEPIGGGGCPVADVLTAKGWTQENSISVRSLDGGLAEDVYPISGVPDPVLGSFQIRIHENEDEESTFDRALLGVVDHDEGTNPFVFGEQAVQGTLLYPGRVTNGRGEELTRLFADASASGMVGDPGEVLTFEFPPAAPKSSGKGTDSAPGSTQDGGQGFTMDSGTKVIPDEARFRPSVELAAAGIDERILGLTGLDVQVPDGTGGWSTIERVYPREAPSSSALSGLPTGPIRIAFAGRHSLRNVGRIIPSAVVPLIRWLPPSRAVHSSLGDVVKPLAAADQGTIVLTKGDTISMTFEALAPVPGKVRNFYLRTLGSYRTRSLVPASNPASATQVAPVRFALGTPRPNPTSGSTSFSYSLAKPGSVELRVYDVAGRSVRTLVRSIQAAGLHELVWDGTTDAGAKAPAGVYVIRLSAGVESAKRKLILLNR